MTEQERLHIRAELARATEWTNITGDVGFPPETTKELAYCSEAFKRAICGQMKRRIPDPFTDAADNRALVAWMAADEARWFVFIRKLIGLIAWPEQSLQDMTDATFAKYLREVKYLMTAPLDTITLAAAKVLGTQEVGG